ncbi:MAG TPA: hypothetical protein VMD53_01975 [Rhizomicrobium sp.]|nr:hypothetical protein [Rhizomicrobium sp.]
MSLISWKLVEEWGSRMGKYSAMTVNERLAEAGVYNAFETALTRGDRAGIISALKTVEIEGAWADEIADRLLANPDAYLHPKFKL